MWRRKTTTTQKRERKKSNLTIHISSGSCWCNFEGSNEIRREYLPWNTLINFILSSSDAPNNRSASNGWQSSNNPSSKLIRSERAFWRPFPKPMMEDIIDQINNWQPFLVLSEACLQWPRCAGAVRWSNPSQLWCRPLLGCVIVSISRENSICSSRFSSVLPSVVGGCWGRGGDGTGGCVWDQRSKMRHL